jgi:hypothetical protein
MVVLGEGRFLMSEVLMYSVRECVHTVLHTKETVNLETSPHTTFHRGVSGLADSFPCR